MKPKGIVKSSVKKLLCKAFIDFLPEKILRKV